MKKKFVSFLSIVAVSFVFLCFPVQVRAGWWGEAEVASYLKERLEEAYQYLQDTMLGNLKVSAYQFLSQQITSIISGNGFVDGAQFIKNWENYMYNYAKATARVAVNDFFTTTLRGTDSRSSYVSAGASEGYGSGGSYTQYLRSGAEAAVSSKTGKYTLDQYCTDPFQMFGGGDMGCFIHYFDPFNNPFAYSMEVKKRYEEFVAKQEDLARTKAIAYSGYKDVKDKKTGQTTTPGTVIRGIMDSLNNQLIGLPAQAKSPAEIATMTAGTFINSLMKQALQQGLARVENEVYSRARQKINEGIRQAVDRMGPAGKFLDESGSTAAIQQGTNRWLLGT